MIRPDRFKYVRKLAPESGCVFCTALKKGVGRDSLIVHETQHSMVMLNKYPYNNGHLLVLPKLHSGHLLEISEEIFFDMQKTLRLAVEAILSTFGCPGVNMGLNHGAVAGAGIPDHLHWHVVPRWLGDTNFFPLIAETKVLPETLDQSYDRISTFFRGVK